MAWIKKEFIQTTEFTAIQFDPTNYPWHHSVQRQTRDGKISDYEVYSCIIPCDRITSIRPGDWIIVDDMNNAKDVIPKNFFEMLHIKEKDSSVS